MNYTIEDEFAVSAERFWRVFWDDEYNRALWQHLAVGREVLSQSQTGEGSALVIHRVHRLSPRRELPKAMQKFVQGALAYTETDAFQAASNTMEVVTVPTVLADKIRSRGILRVTTLGPERIRRTWQGECTCSIPLIGGTIERHIVEEVKDSYQKTTTFTRRWFLEHPE